MTASSSSPLPLFLLFILLWVMEMMRSSMIILYCTHTEQWTYNPTRGLTYWGPLTCPSRLPLNPLFQDILGPTTFGFQTSWPVGGKWPQYLAQAPEFCRLIQNFIKARQPEWHECKLNKKFGVCACGSPVVAVSHVVPLLANTKG